MESLKRSKWLFPFVFVLLCIFKKGQRCLFQKSSIVYMCITERRGERQPLSSVCCIAVASVGLHERMQCKSSHGFTSAVVCFCGFYETLFEYNNLDGIWVWVKRMLETIQIKITVIITQTSVCWIHLYCTFDTETSLSVR